jgi:protein gp37
MSLNRTKIEWADYTWNPMWGCKQIRDGCAHCYAKAIHDRRHKAFLAGKKVALCYGQPFEKVQWTNDYIASGLGRDRPRIVFACSMSDLFYEKRPVAHIHFLFSTMRLFPQTQFVVLTKRPANAHVCFEQLRQSLKVWPLPNVWLGVSISHQPDADELIPQLLELPAAYHIVSVEPMLGPVNLRPWLSKLAWVICGAETGKNRRPMELVWAIDLWAHVAFAGVPFFFKKDSTGKCPREMHREWPAEMKRA